jgi:hypothetical protein
MYTVATASSNPRPIPPKNLKKIKRGLILTTRRNGANQARAHSKEDIKIN